MANTRPTSTNRGDNLKQLRQAYRGDAQGFELRLNEQYEQKLKEAAAARKEFELDAIEAIYKKKIDFLNKETKFRIKLEQKYGTDEKSMTGKIKKKYDTELAEYRKFLAKKAAIDAHDEQQKERREVAEAKREAAGIIRHNKLFDWKGWSDAAHTGGLSFSAAVDGIVAGLSDFAKKLENTIDTIGNYQSRWDTRLYGYSGAGYSSITKMVTGAAGVSPYVQQSKIMQNIDSLIQQGIAFNVEQRGFLQTISDKIATTFDAANGTLLQLVRIQQQDTTAARLGLEAGVTKYLNNMFSSSEYMTSLYKTVLGNIYEASSQFSGKGSIGFEYQVQKWLGSLYSVGMSESAIQSISSAIGQLGSGNINALSGNTALQNLLVMSASRGGLSYANLLTGGLGSSDVNKLMAGLVSYLAEIGSSNNNVVKSQYANIFGMSLSDLKAASNLASSISTISRSNMDYASSISNLFGMANTIGSRTSIGEMFGNVWDNLQYSMASGIASNPALYAIYKSAGLLDSVAGGIALPDIKYLGTGVNLQTTVADLMRVTALSGGILSSIGQMISAGGGGGFSGQGMLNAFGITGAANTVTRGSGLNFNAPGVSVSKSNFIANASGEEYQEGTIAGAEDEASKKLEVMQEEQEDEKLNELKAANDKMDDIIRLLSVTGIKVANYTDFNFTA